jgi:hypothetical protein
LTSASGKNRSLSPTVMASGIFRPAAAVLVSSWGERQAPACRAPAAKYPDSSIDM